MATSTQIVGGSASVPRKKNRRRPYHAGTIVKRHTSRTERPRKRKIYNKTESISALASKEKTKLPPVAEGAVRIVPLGGAEEVGKNMLVIETKDDIIISDVGFQFVGEEEAPGIDYILPNTRYLEERKDKIRGILITHGHLDHIGGIPYIAGRIGNPPIYTAEITALMIRKRQEEFPGLPALNIKIIAPWEKIRLGKLTLRGFPVTHSIPDSMGALIGTEYGNIVITGDIKLEHENEIPSEKEKETFEKIGKEHNLLLIADSTNAERSGFSIPEKVVEKNLETIIRETNGRLFIGTFASQFDRMIHIIKSCEKLGKKIVMEGRSIKTNIEIAQYGKILTPKKYTIIPSESMRDYPPDRIVILATGAQGEEFAALMRIATNKHKHIILNERDTVVLSSSIIPGNESNVQKLKDNLYRRAGKIIHYRASDVHSTGHGNAGELVWINKKVGARFFMPSYGYHSMLRSHAQAITEEKFPKENVIIPDNGMLIDIEKGKKLVIHKEKAPVNLMMVDGFAVGDTQEVVIRDRKSLAADGMFVIIATVNIKTGKLRKSPDIISRGFVYLRESQGLLQETRNLIKKTVEETTKGMRPIDFDYLKKRITETVSSFLFRKTAKTPVVIPVILGL
ncbi:MAG: ribonuclease J [Candidatus Pacebacteria bacterium]|nr:ribonuclease J [Candidatus Paceibacterota bacterium]